MKKNKNLKGKRMKEQPKLSKSVKKNFRKGNKTKNKSKLLYILSSIGLVISIPIAFILDTLITVLKIIGVFGLILFALIYEFLKLILKIIKNLIIFIFKFTKKHPKLVIKSIILTIILVLGLKLGQYVNTYINNLNDKLDKIDTTINDMIDKDEQLQQDINVLSEQYNVNAEDLKNKDKELQEKQEEVNKLQKQVNSLQVTSRGGMTSRSSNSLSEKSKETQTTVATGTKGEHQSYAHDLCINTYGWSEYDFTCLVKLWNRESGWNSSAHNKSSGAHGIAQALPASKMASEGSDYYTNGKTQIRWGLKYIKNRYGSPSSAWAHSQQTGWY